MALDKISKTITLNAKSVVDDKTIAEFFANIDSNNLDNTLPNRSVLNNVEYRNNRAAVLKDQQDFEDAVYTLLTDTSNETTTTTTTTTAKTTTTGK